VNYHEDKVGTYTLADPLKLEDGTPVLDAKTWFSLRRPEILKMFETQQYGVMPGRPADESFEVTDKSTPALNGKAIRKQVTIHLSKDPSWPVIHLLEYIPANSKKPVPMYFDINFGAVQAAVDDPGITPQKVRDPKTNELVPPPPPGGRGFGKINVEVFLDAGIGVATFNYAELDPDTLTGFPQGIRAKYMKPGQTGEDDRAPDAWGSISAWAWGMSRVEDYFETDKQVDAKRVAIHGVSRLGKTVTWAGAYDQRFAAVIASCGGEGGAALSHRDYGETIAHLNGAVTLSVPVRSELREVRGIPGHGALRRAHAAGAYRAASGAATDGQHGLLVRSEGRVPGRRCRRAGLQAGGQTGPGHRCVAGGEGAAVLEWPELLHA
jgi:hypothetical protein